MTLRRVPKPTPKSSDAHEAIFHARGSDGALKAATNILRTIGIVTVEKSHSRGDGEVDQTIRLRVYTLARNYSTPPERPYEDKSGDVYVFASITNPGEYKIGSTVRDPLQRKREVSQDYHEQFQRIIIIHTDEDVDALELMIHNKLKAEGVWLGREKFKLTEQHLIWLQRLADR